MYSPLPDFIKIKQSSIHGMGLFTTHKIQKDFVIGITHIEHKEFQHDHIRTPLGGFYNHSEEPNCVLKKDELEDGTNVKVLTADRDIEIGEELTCFYTFYSLPPLQSKNPVEEWKYRKVDNRFAEITNN